MKWLRATLLACLLAGVGLGGAESNAEAFQARSNILTLTTGAPPFLSLTYERVGWSLFGLQGSAGATLDLSENAILDLRPFVSLGYYGDYTAWWIEFSAPKEVLPIRREDSNWLLVGFEYRF